MLVFNWVFSWGVCEISTSHLRKMRTIPYKQCKACQMLCSLRTSRLYCLLRVVKSLGTNFSIDKVKTSFFYQETTYSPVHFIFVTQHSLHITLIFQHNNLTHPITNALIFVLMYYIRNKWLSECWIAQSPLLYETPHRFRVVYPPNLNSLPPISHMLVNKL